jgi:hypothetical protein
LYLDLEGGCAFYHLLHCTLEIEGIFLCPNVITLFMTFIPCNPAPGTV